MQPESGALIRAERLGKRIRGAEILTDVSLSVAPGSVHALVGMNGAGKTTLMRILLGMLSADTGAAWLLGAPVERMGPGGWSQVGQMIETPAPYPELTTRENISAAALLHGVARKDVDAMVEPVIDDLGLVRWRDERANRLSLGTRQKVALACALVHAPRVLVLDEPANALDPRALVAVRRLIAGVADRGGAVLISSHHLDEIARVATEVTVMHRGSVVGRLDPSGRELERVFFDMVYEADRLLPEESS